MAPRGRGRPRKGGMRMDAALDAMRPFGFSDKLIRETMNELLEVYTDEGWMLIEEGSYEVLREALLAKVEEEESKQNMINSPFFEDGGDGTSTTAGPSGGVPLLSCSNRGNEAFAAQIDEVMDTSFPANEVPDAALPTNEGLKNNDQIPCAEFPEQVDNPHIRRRRRPCHGWIGSSGGDHLIYLTPAPLPEKLAELFRKNRKRRWDVKPEEA